MYCFSERWLVSLFPLLSISLVPGLNELKGFKTRGLLKVKGALVVVVVVVGVVVDVVVVVVVRALDVVDGLRFRLGVNSAIIRSV